MKAVHCTGHCHTGKSITAVLGQSIAITVMSIGRLTTPKQMEMPSGQAITGNVIIASSGNNLGAEKINTHTLNRK